MCLCALLPSDEECETDDYFLFCVSEQEHTRGEGGYVLTCVCVCVCVCARVFACVWVSAQRD